MPVFEFVCQSCSHPFEELARADERVPCPACKSRKVEKRFSTFATSNDARSAGGVTSNESPAAGCGTCGDPRGPGACALD